jgi:hypothetical protein
MTLGPRHLEIPMSHLPTPSAALVRTLAAIGLAATLLPAAAAPVPGQGSWQSTLHARDLDGDGLADADYDSALDITWLRDWGLAGGAMVWDDAMAWAAGLDVGGHTGWRLPQAVDSGAPGCDWAMAGTDCGYNPTVDSSELSHLFTVTLGNLSYYAPDAEIGDPAQAGWGLSNTAHFVGMLPQRYWTGTELAGTDHSAWYYAMWGFQGPASKAVYDGYPFIHATAVHDGDIGAAVAPLPAPSALGLGLAALGLLAASTRRPVRHPAP